MLIMKVPTLYYFGPALKDLSLGYGCFGVWDAASLSRVTASSCSIIDVVCSTVVCRSRCSYYTNLPPSHLAGMVLVWLNVKNVPRLSLCVGLVRLVRAVEPKQLGFLHLWFRV